MDGAPKIKNLSRDITTPLSGMVCFVVRRLGLATVNLYTKYEVSMVTHYKDMKGDEKCKIEEVWRCYGSPKVIGNIAI